MCPLMRAVLPSAVPHRGHMCPLLSPRQGTLQQPCWMILCPFLRGLAVMQMSQAKRSILANQWVSRGNNPHWSGCLCANSCCIANGRSDGHVEWATPG
jgi:hypothetical protein